jgi:viroplasmin and RNaseH domain-containing protein
MSKTKFYTVWSGKTPGVYASWKECEEQVKGVEGAKYKSFDTREEAEKALKAIIGNLENPNRKNQLRLCRMLTS